MLLSSWSHIAVSLGDFACQNSRYPSIHNEVHYSYKRENALIWTCVLNQKRETEPSLEISFSPQHLHASSSTFTCCSHASGRSACSTLSGGSSTMTLPHGAAAGRRSCADSKYGSTCEITFRSRWDNFKTPVKRAWRFTVTMYFIHCPLYELCKAISVPSVTTRSLDLHQQDSWQANFFTHHNHK